MDELLALHHGGVFLRRDALALGYSDDDLSKAMRAGVLVRVRHGAYGSAAQWQAADEQRRHLLRCHAVALSHAGEIAFSHASGAIAHGLRVWGTDLDDVHVVRLDRQTGRRLGGVIHHTGGWSDLEVVDVDGLRVLAPGACAMGLAASASVESGLVALDSAYDLGLATEPELRSLMDEMRQWPDTRRLQVTLRLAQPGAQSVGESRLRYLCWATHLPKPILQYEVRHPDGWLIGTTDMAWPEQGLLGEFDGRIKFGRVLRAGESPGDAAFREKVREDRLREATGWPMIRVVWDDLADRPGTSERIRRQLFRRAH